MWRQYLRAFRTHRLALKTWGTKQQSASVISSPTEYLPEQFSKRFSIAVSNHSEVNSWKKNKQYLGTVNIKMHHTSESSIYPVLCPLQSFLFSTYIFNMRKQAHILQRLYSRLYHFTDLSHLDDKQSLQSLVNLSDESNSVYSAVFSSYFGPFVRISWHKRILWPSFL